MTSLHRAPGPGRDRRASRARRARPAMTATRPRTGRRVRPRRPAPRRQVVTQTALPRKDERGPQPAPTQASPAPRQAAQETAGPKSPDRDDAHGASRRAAQPPDRLARGLHGHLGRSLHVLRADAGIPTSAVLFASGAPAGAAGMRARDLQ